MTRRIVRALFKLGATAILALLAVFFLDNQFRVLPSSIHHYMPAHNPGLVITDITVTQCSSVNVFRKCKLDPNVWTRIEKDLYLGTGWVSKAYVHVQSKAESQLTEEDTIVVDVSVGKLNPGGSDKKKSGAWEKRPGGLWLKTSARLKDSDDQQTVTAVDVLFGADAVDPRAGWNIVGTPFLLGTEGESHEPRLTIRRGSHGSPPKPSPKINEQGKFKIMQVADLHLSTGTGKCRDEMPEGLNGGHCEADPRTLDFIERLLDTEKPDMVVLSGDQVNGDTAPDAQSAIFKYADLFIKRKIPFASIFGNHDDEGSMPRAQQMALIETLPYSLSRAGPDGIDGVGNYYVEVSAHSSKTSALTLYLLDTHAYSPDERTFKGYDWIKQNQIDWFKTTAGKLKHGHEKYKHIHMDLAFIHIPLPEYRDTANVIIGGVNGEPREGVTAPGYNSGFRDALVEEGVVLVSCGHDHVNEYCALSTTANHDPALWMCYAGGAGFGGYAGYGGYHRRVRFFEIDMNEARITTYKKVEYGDLEKRVDELIVVEGGKPVGAEGESKGS